MFKIYQKSKRTDLNKDRNRNANELAVYFEGT